MLPGEYDITIYRGSTWGISVEGMTGTDRNPINTIFSDVYDAAKLHMRHAWDMQTVPEDDPLFEMSTMNGRITIVGISLVLELTAAETLALTFDQAQYALDLIRYGTPDVVDTILFGSVTVMREITT